MKLICNYCGSDTMEVGHSEGCLVLQIEVFKSEIAALSELLSHLVDVELERDKFADVLRNIECASCEHSLLECTCEESE